MLGLMIQSLTLHWHWLMASQLQANTHKAKTHLVKIDGVHIQSVPRGGAVLWWRKVGPAIQPSTAIGMALKKVTQTPELCSGNASIFGTSD